MTESEGCTLLREEFERAGYHVATNHRFTENGLDVTLDGWDAARRVGFEFITQEAMDYFEFTPDAIARIEAMNAAGTAAILLVDEEIPDAESLRFMARGFLARLGARS